MSFRGAVEAVPTIRAAYKKGLQALPQADRHHFTIANTRKLTGSVFLEEALREIEPQSPLWDYGIGLHASANERAIWIEVHPANSLHVDGVLRKLAWLRNWLKESAPALDDISHAFVWIASGRVELPAGSPQRRKIAMAGLQFQARLVSLDNFR